MEINYSIQVLRTDGSFVGQDTQPDEYKTVMTAVFHADAEGAARMLAERDAGDAYRVVAHAKRTADGKTLLAEQVIWAGRFSKTEIELEDDGTLDTVVCCTRCGITERFSEVDRDSHGFITDEGWEWMQAAHEDDCHRLDEQNEER